jgi:hypothetical protein
MKEHFMDDNQLVISNELLKLFKWLLENDIDGLKKLTQKALRKGLKETINNTPCMHSDEYETHEDMQQYVSDFFLVMESLIQESVHEEEVNKIVERNLMPSIDKIDSASCNTQIIASSVAKAASTCESDPQEDPKTALCKELLKRWKPNKETISN